MFASALWLGCVSLLLCPSQSCYHCFVNVKDSLRLCWGYLLTEYNVRNVDTCFEKLDHIFNNNKTVINAGRVGARDFLCAAILLRKKLANLKFICNSM